MNEVQILKERNDVEILNRKQAVSKRFLKEIHKACGFVVEYGAVAIVSTVFAPIA